MTEANRTDDLKFTSTLDGCDVSYDRVKELVCSDGWTSCITRLTPVTFQRAFDVSYEDSFAIARQLVADGVLAEAGLHEWRYAP